MSISRRRFFVASLNSVLLRGVLTLVLVALFAGLAGELWLQPQPLLRATKLYSTEVSALFGTGDVDGDGRLEWIMHSTNPDYDASLVVRHLPGASPQVHGDRQYYFSGKKVLGRIAVVEGRNGSRHLFTTSIGPEGSTLSCMQFAGSRIVSRWDTLLFDGSRATFSETEYPAISSTPVLLPDSTRFLIPINGNFSTWRGALVVNPDHRESLTLFPAGLGISYIDERLLLDPRGQPRVLVYNGAANNHNDLGGIADTCAALMLFDADSGFVRVRQLTGFKNLRAAVFPDQRHVLVLGFDAYQPNNAHPNLMIWDTWHDRMTVERVTGVPRQTLAKTSNGILWYDLDGQVREARVETLTYRKLYRLPYEHDARTKAIGDYWWSSIRERPSELRRISDGRLLLRETIADFSRAAWIEPGPARNTPLLLHVVFQGQEVRPAICLALHTVPFFQRWLRHPYLLLSLIPGCFLFLLFLVLRMFSQETLIRRLVPQQEQAIGLLDHKGRLVYVNDLLEELIAAPPDRSGDLWVEQIAAAGWRGESRLKERRYRWTSQPVSRRMGTSWMKVQAEDITERRENEQQRLFLAKLAVMAHDLKSPLTPIQMQADLLESRLAALPEEDRAAARQSIDAIHEGVERSLSLIQRFMNMARIEFQTELVSLPAVIHGAIADCKKGNGIGITFTTDWDRSQAWVASAEPEVLQLVLLELLQNAVQAMDGRGAINIRLIRLPQNGIELTLCDTGPGIAADQRDKVWDPGYTTRERGTGFGLYFVKRVLELQQIDVALAAAEGGGLAVSLSIPGTQKSGAADGRKQALNQAGPAA